MGILPDDPPLEMWSTSKTSRGTSTFIVCLSVVYLCVCPSISLSVRLSVRLSVCPMVCLPVCFLCCRFPRVSRRGREALVEGWRAAPQRVKVLGSMLCGRSCVHVPVPRATFTSFLSRGSRHVHIFEVVSLLWFSVSWRVIMALQVSQHGLASPDKICGATF